jgi:hypothetical protein
MKFPFARELFPELEFSLERLDAVNAKCDALLSETLDCATRFLDDEHGIVNDHVWKKLKQCDSSLTLYRERRPGSMGMRARSSTFIGRDQTTAVPPPSFLLVGQLLSGLDDLMLGMTTATAEDQRVRSSYVQDGIIDCQLLEQLRTPTHAAPFHHRNLKWIASKPAGNVPLTRPRDYVVVDEAGIIDSNTGGPRVGYSLRHSVQLEGVDSLLDQYKIVRGAMSICGVFHEIYPSVVHVYLHMTFEHRARRGVNKSLATAAALEYSLALSRMAQVAQLKKLTSAIHATERSLKRKAPLSATQGLDDGSISSYGSSTTSFASSMGFQQSGMGFLRSPTKQEDGESCTSCCQWVKPPVTPEEAQESKCGLCRQLLCRVCRVRQELSFVGRANRVHRSKYSFCKDCISRTARKNAAQVAIVDQTQRELDLLTKAASGRGWGQATQMVYYERVDPPASVTSADEAGDEDEDEESCTFDI